jgi:hypothetical protein
MLFTVHVRRHKVKFFTDEIKSMSLSVEIPVGYVIEFETKSRVVCEKCGSNTNVPERRYFKITDVEKFKSDKRKMCSENNRECLTSIELCWKCPGDAEFVDYRELCKKYGEPINEEEFKKLKTDVGLAIWGTYSDGSIGSLREHPILDK